MKISVALTKVLPWQCGGNTWGFLYKAKRAARENAVVLPTSSHRRVGLLAGICWTKSQSPHYFPRVCVCVWGGGVQMTGA